MTVLAERYELGDLLGTGGMARVVAGHDTVLDRPVAVKLLRDVPDDGARERFLREARSSARLRHPSAVAVYDTGEDDGQPYIVMELVEGRSLGDLLRERGQLDIEEAVAITASVLDALAAAHRSGLVHRDVKPGNVLLPDEGGVKLSDFGIAKALDDAGEGLTATGSVLGTPTFLAPELIEGVPASPASDLYSVGCLLYAQLAGRPPFHEGGPLAVAYAHRHDPVPPIEEHRSDVPDDLRDVLDRSLAKDPGERFADADAMRTALLDGPDALPSRTQVLPAPASTATAEVPTQAVGATAEPTSDGPVTHERGRRRGVIVALIVLALLGLGVWALVAALGDGDEEPQEELETPVDETPDEPDPEPEPDPPTDEPEETPGTPEPPPTDPGPDDPPVDEAPETPEPEEPAPEEPEPGEPETEDPDTEADEGAGDDVEGPDDGAAPGPPDEVPGEGQPGGGSTLGTDGAPASDDAPADGGAAPDAGTVGGTSGDVAPAPTDQGSSVAVPDTPDPEGST